MCCRFGYPAFFILNQDSLRELMVIQGFSGKNKREFQRINLELKGSYRVVGLERSDGCAEIQNIGHGGLMFISSSSLNRGDSLDMTIYYQEFEIPINISVVWSEKLMGTLPNEFKYGVKYLASSNMERSYLSLIIGSNHESD